ncbi:hypothetical protein IKE96_02915 [bacterium]|nr:hypothetical protein [bacterium]
MYFKVDRKVLKKALVWLKKQDDYVTVVTYDSGVNGTGQKKVTRELNLEKQKYIEQIQFALYKTRLNEFYIDYDFAFAIRPALLAKQK